MRLCGAMSDYVRLFEAIYAYAVTCGHAKLSTNTYDYVRLCAVMCIYVRLCETNATMFCYLRRCDAMCGYVRLREVMYDYVRLYAVM